MDTNKENRLAWLALNSIKGLGPVRVNTLVKQYGSAAALFHRDSFADIKQWAAHAAVAAELEKPEILFAKAQAKIDAAAAQGIIVLTQADDEYPPLLREIDAPPPVLYVKGKLDCFSRHCIGMVGTRRPTSYGKGVAASIAKQLVENKITIVSGLALGIDTVSHRACLDNNGTTIAVLGCGLDRIYPPSNKHLAEEIVKTGALVSEFDCGTLPETYNFPRRNRVISGLSAGVLVVEAPRRSGSLITANYALVQGRDVFAVPGPINSEMSDGTFDLIKNGAVPVQSGADILENIREIHLKTIMASAEAHSLEIRHTMPLPLLTEQERKLYDHIASEPRRLDTLAERAGTSVADLFDVLLNLELKGMIRQVAGQQFVRA